MHDIKRMREVVLIIQLTSTCMTNRPSMHQLAKMRQLPYKKHLKTSKDAEFEGILFQNDEDIAWQSREIFLQMFALLGDRSLFIAWGGSEDFGLNTMKFSRSPL